MKRRIHLVNPRGDHPSYFNADVMAEACGRPTASVLSLALPTVAAYIPEEFEVTICDESISPADLDVDAEFIGLTGMVSQRRRLRELATAYRERNKTVVIGGPLASLCPDEVRPYADILVRGEIEGIADELFADLARGEWRDEYVGGRVDLADSPVPRLDLYPNDRTLVGAVQTSRGCPFKCEFCEVILYHGNRQRFKPIATILDELRQLRDIGYRNVFITDDNLTANKRRSRELLTAIRDWNRRQPEPLSFTTQLSIEAATDDELLTLAADAGLSRVFVGIETPSEDALREVGKTNNCKRDFVALIENFTRHGITVTGGMIVGFDADDASIFERQFEFAMSLPVAVYSPGALFAPERTPLHARLQKEGRIDDRAFDEHYMPWMTNVLPAQMTRDELAKGMKWLVNNLYAPRNFERRVRRLAGLLKSSRAGERRGRRRFPRLRPVDRDCLQLLKKLPRLGRAEARLALRLTLLVLRSPSALQTILDCLLSYLQVRYMLERHDFWDASLAHRPYTTREPEGRLAQAGAA